MPFPHTNIENRVFAILNSANINWIFSPYFELTSANIKNFLPNAHKIIKFEIQPRLVFGINCYAKNQLSASSKLLGVTSATELELLIITVLA